MSILSVARVASYTGNGSTHTFSLAALVYAAATDIVVKVNGVVRSLNADYEITGTYPSQSVHFIYWPLGVKTDLPPVNGAAISLERITPSTQPTVYRNQGQYFAKTHEASFDRMTMLVQDEAGLRAAADIVLSAMNAEGIAGGNSTVVTATGTTTGRTQADRAADTAANPMNFGAVGDGTTDDRNAVQACVDYCLSYTPPKAMLVTHRHRLASSVNIDRAVSGLPVVSQFKINGYGDNAGFHATTNINFFSSTINIVGGDPKSGGFTFHNVGFSTDSISRTTYVLAEKFLRVKFINCTFTLIKCYDYATCYAQEIDWTSCKITNWPGVFAASQGCFGGYFMGCNIFGQGNGTGLYSASGSTYSATGFKMIGNIIETIGGYIASLTGCAGVLIQGNHIESIQAGPLFALWTGSLRNRSIAFVGNYYLFYAGPIVDCGPSDSIVSIDNHVTTDGNSLVPNRTMYASMAQVTSLVSIGDQFTGTATLVALSDATHSSTVMGVTRAGAATDAWIDSDNHFNKDSTGHFGFGRAAVSVTRATFQGEDTSATKYAGSFLDSGGNAIALFRNDRHVLMPGLPTSSAGLASGELWRDAGDSDRVKAVP